MFIRKTSIHAIDGNHYYVLFDDAMVSMRYAWNFAHGNGLVWNIGEHIEGYTNTLMTLYMSFWSIFMPKSAVAMVIQISGVWFMLLVSSISVRITQLLFNRYQIARHNLLLGLAFIVGLAYYPLPYWSLMGMETGLLTLILFAAVWSILRQDNRRPQVAIGLAILLGLAFMTRPDALVPALVLWAYRLLNLWPVKPSRQQLKQLSRIVITELTIILVFVVALTLFRLAYYGSPVPNTYLLKVQGFPLDFRLTNGLGFIVPFLREMAVALFCTLILALVTRHKEVLLIVVLFSIIVVYQIWTGGEPWPRWRILAPFVPLLFVACIFLFAKLFNQVAEIRRPVLASTLTCLAMAILILTANQTFLAEAMFRTGIYEIGFNRENLNTALAIQASTKPNATIAVLSAGTIPYYADRYAIDMLGKSDTYIASLPPDISGDFALFGMKSVPGHNKYDLHYSILKLKPTYVQALVWGHDDLRDEAVQYREYSYQGITLMFDSTSAAVDWNVVNQK